MPADLEADNRKLVEQFGAKPISTLKDEPDCYTFARGLVYSHRDLDKFLKALRAGEECAIVSGFNASGTIHLGHKAVFDTNLYFQRVHGCPVFIPISDDESYVSGKVDTQEEALENALRLAKELLAYGFDPEKTYFVIDQLYTDIYTLAFLLSRRVTMSEVKASYGYGNDENMGLHFYPAVQAAHVLFPEKFAGIKHTLVPIGPDEDAHLRIARDAAGRAGFAKPAVLHLAFQPGLDGEKMSKSRNNAVYLNESPKQIRKKIMKAFSGGQPTVEEQREKGGDPEIDISCQYLKKYFLSPQEADELFTKYRNGELLSGEVKQLLAEKTIAFTTEFQERLANVTDDDLEKALLRNGDTYR